MKKLIALLLLVPALALARETVKIVVPFAAGGPNDLLARVVEKNLNESIKDVDFVVDFRTGAGGLIGIRSVAADKSSNTTLMVVSSAVVTNSIKPDAGYNIQQDFLPVVYLGSQTMALVVNRSNNIRTIKDFLEIDPGRAMNYGSGGFGAGGHIGGEILQQSTGLNLVHIPFKGEIPALTDLIGGRTDFQFIGVHTAVNYADKINILAVTSQRRDTMVPDVPTLTESGVRGFKQPVQYYSVLANSTADKKLVKRIQQVLVNALKDPEKSKEFQRISMEINTSKLTNFSDIFEKDVARVRPILEKNNDTQ
jgi:tripartite-type tricarboxylate transporter receptor subunit TctC